MTIETAELFWLAVGGYLGVGLVVGAAFLFLAAGKLDDAANGASLWFRLTSLPGAALLWPFVLGRWLSGRRINQPIAGRDDA
ncbi:MAG: hypothetical protein ACFB00_06475 [Parvularculaceae bacterium]